MNVFELMVWAISAFGDFANAATYFFFNQPLTFTLALVAEAPFEYLTVPNIASLILNPITMSLIWAWQVTKTVIA